MIVLGLGYGDEGKGHVTNHLAHKTQKSIVVRFNGGHQAGHTVRRHGHRHIFSSFGSGTLNMRPTYWTKHCVFYPTAFNNELNAIIKYYLNNHAKSLDFMPKYYIDALCPVATPFDMLANQNDSVNKSHGTCGVGFGQTLKRHFDNHLKLYVQDLFHDSVLKMKLENIKAHYCTYDMISLMYRNVPDFDINLLMDKFIGEIKEIRPYLNVVTDNGLQLFNQHVPVFEGAQGILLDQDFGFFPNVTRSNTTSKNALEIASSIPSRYGHHGKQAQIYYVTRCYQTRHGNGPMTYENEIDVSKLKNIENETNVTNDYQGKFRYGALDIDMINYAIECDNHFSKDNVKNLVITCYDQVEKRFPVYKNKQLHSVDPFELSKLIDHRFNNVLVSNGDLEENIESLWKK